MIFWIQLQTSQVGLPQYSLLTLLFFEILGNPFDWIVLKFTIIVSLLLLLCLLFEITVHLYLYFLLCIII